MRTIRVRLPSRSYSILIQEGVLGEIGARCKALGLGRSCAVISDDHVGPLFAGKSQKALERAGFNTLGISIPSDERAKSLKVVARCYDELAAARLDRQSFIVALGGGVVGDLAGFVAATYLRGIDLVQVPTTLLAQVDSAVGGKVGINLPAGKNLVGAFLQPRLVLADPLALQTLPERQFRSGLAEVIKYGIIDDGGLFETLEREMGRLLGRKTSVLEPIIARCCQIKAKIVQQDETEGGVRAILNFGHTVGHALEATLGYGRMLHGEAIAAGQVIEARVSEKILGLPARETGRIRALLERAGLPVRVRLRPRQMAAVIETMQLDKKNRRGEIRFVLAKRIGAVKYGCAVPPGVIRQLLEEQNLATVPPVPALFAPP